MDVILFFVWGVRVENCKCFNSLYPVIQEWSFTLSITWATFDSLLWKIWRLRSFQINQTKTSYFSWKLMSISFLKRWAPPNWEAYIPISDGISKKWQSKNSWFTKSSIPQPLEHNKYLGLRSLRREKLSLASNLWFTNLNEKKGTHRGSTLF